MRVTCLQENLFKGLNIIGRAVASRTTLPITQNVLLETDESRLKLSATNLEIAVSTWVPGEIIEEGSLTVPARLLSEFVGALPNENVNLTSEVDPYSLTVNCARFDARIMGTDAVEFPPLPTVSSGISVQVHSKVLRKAVTEVVFAAATTEDRPVLTGVQMELGEGKFTLAAADGFRLAVHSSPVDGSISESVSAIVPAKSFSELNRLLGDHDQLVEIRLDADRGQILFQLENTEMVSQLIQGSFPNYTQLIPQQWTTRSTVEVDGFLRTTRTAAIFARDGSGIVRLHLTPGSPGSLHMLARADEVGENKSEMDAQIEGEEAKVAFSSKYLIDVLNVIGEQNVTVELTNPSSPGVFRPLGSDNYVHVIMPMFVQW